LFVNVRTATEHTAVLRPQLPFWTAYTDFRARFALNCENQFSLQECCL